MIHPRHQVHQDARLAAFAIEHHRHPGRARGGRGGGHPFLPARVAAQRPGLLQFFEWQPGRVRPQSRSAEGNDRPFPARVHQDGADRRPPARHAAQARDIHPLGGQRLGQRFPVQVIADPPPEGGPPAQPKGRDRRIGGHAAGADAVGPGGDLRRRLRYVLDPEGVVRHDVAETDDERLAR